MDLEKIYHSEDGRRCNIVQMVRENIDWAANRIQEGEKAIAEIDALKKSKGCPLYKDYEKSCKALRKREKELADNNEKRN